MACSACAARREAIRRAGVSVIAEVQSKVRRLSKVVVARPTIGAAPKR